MLLPPLLAWVSMVLAARGVRSPAARRLALRSRPAGLTIIRDRFRRVALATARCGSLARFQAPCIFSSSQCATTIVLMVVQYLLIISEITFSIVLCVRRSAAAACSGRAVTCNFDRIRRTTVGTVLP